MPPELAELLYRERFKLSWGQMQDEPAEAVNFWLDVEEVRAEIRQEQEAKLKRKR